MLVAKKTIPIVKEIIVEVSGVNYTDGIGKKCPVVDVWCNATNGKVVVICGETFSLGSSFCEKEFGKKQFADIQRICQAAIRTYKTKYSEINYKIS